MGRCMVTIVHVNSDTIKAAELRHLRICCAALHVVLHCSACQVQVKRVGAHVDVLAPADSTSGAYTHVCEERPICPRFEHTTTGKMRQVDFPFCSIIVAQPDAVRFSRLHFDRAGWFLVVLLHKSCSIYPIVHCILSRSRRRVWSLWSSCSIYPIVHCILLWGISCNYVLSQDHR